MNDTIIILQAVEKLGTKLREEFEIDVRVRFVGDGQRHVFLSLFNNEEHKCLYVDNFGHKSESALEFCDRLIAHCEDNDLFRKS